MALGVRAPRSESSFSQVELLAPLRQVSPRSDLENYFRAVDDESNIRGRRYDSYFEAVVAEALHRSGVDFRHAKWSEWLRRIGSDPFLEDGKYVPDFITKLLVGDRVVVIEPHGGRFFNDHCYEKFERFFKEKGDKLYFIIITDMTEEKLLFNLKTRNIDKIADEVWHIPSYSRNPIGKKGGRTMSEPVENDVNEILQKLRGLRMRAMQREADPIIN